MRVMRYPEVDIFLLCFSVMNSSTLEHIRDVWLPEIRGPCPNAQFLLIGLRADMRDEIPTSWDSPVAKEKAISMGAELGAMKYVECSSRLNHGIQEVFAEALLAGIEVVAARVEQPSAALAPSLRTRTFNGSILGLPRKILDLRRRLQSRREPGRLQSVPEEVMGSTAQEDTGLDTESQLMTINQGEQAGASSDFEETLSRTWVYTRLDRRTLLRTSSVRDNAIFTKKTGSSRLTITPSSRSALSVPMTWTPEDRHSVVSWGSAERNATATMEIIEQYAATLESLQTNPFDAGFPPRMIQSWNNISAEGEARVLNGNIYRNVTNNYVVNYSKLHCKDFTGVS